MDLHQDPVAIPIEEKHRDQGKAELGRVAPDIANQGHRPVGPLADPFAHLPAEGFRIAGDLADQALEEIAQPRQRADEIRQRGRSSGRRERNW